MNYAIILAGGVGSRFWPLSRNTEPKQFLNVCSKKPMIEETLDRISPLIKKKNIYITTNRIYQRKIQKNITRLGIPLKNILFEPDSKNTFPPLAVLSQKIRKLDPQAVMAVLPCDHVITKNQRFIYLLKAALAAAKQGNIVTFGITPRRPETGYGYIKIKPKTRNQKSKIYEIESFIEKPNLLTARKIIKDKRYFWNSGIFIFQPETFLEETKKFLPEVYKNITTENNFPRLWKKLPSLSIDYAIMEKTKRIVLLEADYGWLDLGSWQAIEEVLKKDRSGNIFKGNTLDINSSNAIVWAGERLVATIGLKDIIIVDTKDALLVCSKDQTQDVKQVVRILKQRKAKKYL